MIRDGKADPPEALELKEFARMYIEIRGDLKASSLDEHRRTLTYLQEHFGPERLIGCIMPLDARKFVAWFRKRKTKGHPLAPGTVNKLIRECRRIFREAMDCELIYRNPFAGIRQEKIGQADWYYVSPVEYNRLILACPSLRWRGMITVAYCCGLRRDELLNITWSDIDFEKERLRLFANEPLLAKQNGHPRIKICVFSLCQRRF